MKKILSTRSAPGRHWVGDGFPVHGMFDYGAGAAERSPFLLLDYAAPTRFEPTAKRRGVGQHPHRGFETVTIVYAGEVEHRDSTGQGGVIGPGDVQWMTAGAGILHEEFHSTNYAKTGGPFEMVQLWVNLPAKDKMTPPGYQGILNSDIPQRTLRDAAGAAAGQVRVIAGAFGDGTDRVEGPAHTYTPLNVWDVRVQAGRSVSLAQPEGWTSLLVVLEGTVQVNADTVLRAAQMATLSDAGREIAIEANGDAKLLLLAGEPIDEPVVGYGPFVMNSEAEIRQAIDDFNGGRFGRMQ
ncbi:MAG: pirin family protein [Burkholderiales bacterium]|nr:pirin family protein [Burkholderiales bacterium]